MNLYIKVGDVKYEKMRVFKREDGIQFKQFVFKVMSGSV